MKLLFLGYFICTNLLGENVHAQKQVEELINNESYQHIYVPYMNKTEMKSQLEKDKIEFIKQLSNISIKEMDRLADNGHKIISIEEIGNVSRNSVQNIIKITAGRFNNLNKKKEIEEFPEKSDTINDFLIYDVCQVKINKTGNNAYKVVEKECVVDDKRTHEINQFINNESYQQIYTPIMNKNKIKRQIEEKEIEKNEFIKQWANISLQYYCPFKESNGHKIIRIEEIGNELSTDSVQTKVEVIAGHFNDLNKKKELDENPERKVTTDDFVDYEICTFILNNTYNIEEMSYVLHDKHFHRRINKKRILPNIKLNKTKRWTKIENDEFIKQISNIVLNRMDKLYNGHKIISIEEINNVYKNGSADEKKVKVIAGRFNNLNQKKELDDNPEKSVTTKDFIVYDRCTFTFNRKEDNTSTYEIKSMECVLHDKRRTGIEPLT